MPVKFFKRATFVELGDDDYSFQEFEERVNNFVSKPGIRVRQVSGPHVAHIPEPQGFQGRGRLIYTASVFYDTGVNREDLR